MKLKLNGDETLTDRVLGSPLRTAAIAATVYHGYKRNNSIGWALAWGLAGSVAPIIAVPVAIAQGFGQPKKG